MQIYSRRWRVKLLTVTFYIIVNYFYTKRGFFSSIKNNNRVSTIIPERATLYNRFRIYLK